MSTTVERAMKMREGMPLMLPPKKAARRKPRELEHKEQVAFFRWFRLQYPGVLAYAIPNGGHRHKSVALNLKAEGVTAGMPDIFIADGKPGMFIEMKAKGGRLSDEQKERIGELAMAGYPCAVCFGWEQAKQAAVDYLNKGKKC